MMMPLLTSEILKCTVKVKFLLLPTKGWLLGDTNDNQGESMIDH